MRYDQMTRDLARKAADDVRDAIHRTMAINPTPENNALIAMLAAGSAFAIPAALLAARLKSDPETVADVLIQQVRPMIVEAIRALEVRHG